MSKRTSTPPDHEAYSRDPAVEQQLKEHRNALYNLHRLLGQSRRKATPLILAIFEKIDKIEFRAFDFNMTQKNWVSHFFVKIDVTLLNKKKKDFDSKQEKRKLVVKTYFLCILDPTDFRPFLSKTGGS